MREGERKEKRESGRRRKRRERESGRRRKRREREREKMQPKEAAKSNQHCFLWKSIFNGMSRKCSEGILNFNLAQSDVNTLLDSSTYPE